MKKRHSLYPKEYQSIDFDSIEASQNAGIALKEKKCLHDIYVEIYDLMMTSAKKYLCLDSNAKILEIGSGGGFIKDIYPDIITSDIKKSASIDMVIDAQILPFNNSALDAIFAVHVIHHIPDIHKFLNEANRTLRSYGGIVCIEPYWGLLARFMYKRMHPEPFDEKAATWTLSSSDPMYSSNQALSYILLKRDKKLFQNQFPEFEIIRLKRFGFLRYFCTGGIWLKQKLPDFCFPILKALETVLSPLMPILAIHHAFIIRKKAQKHE